MKIIAKMTVKIKLNRLSFLFPATIAAWDQVIVAPEVNKINVFNRGISHGLKISIPSGGQTPPIPMSGAMLE